MRIGISPMVKDRFDQIYGISLTTIFLCVGTLTALHHEMWRDEIQAWLLARDSISLLDLYRNLKYEGHPGLWHACLLMLSRFTQSPGIMQVFHLLIAATTIYLFGRYSPFTHLHKFLFAFGYFSLYEYSIICRNYALGVLLICIFCVLFQRRYFRFLWVGTVLFLLGHTSVHALIVAITVSFALLVDYISRRNCILAETSIKESHIVIGFSLMGLGILTSLLQIIPPADSGFAVGWYTHYDADRLAKVIKTLTDAFFPVPEATRHFWGTQWLGQFQFYAKIQFMLSCFLVIWFSLMLFRRPIAWLIFLLGTIGLLILFYSKYYGSLRHHGFLFIVFVMVAWIYQSCEGPKGSTSIDRFSAICQKSFRPVLTFILIFHLIGGIIAVCTDYRYVFSYGKATAEFIQTEGLQEMLIVGDKDSAVSTIVGYTEKRSFYYPRSDRFGSFIVWNQARIHEVSDEQVIESAKKIGVESEADVLIILNRMLEQDLVAQHSLTELAKFTGSIVSSEAFHLYLVAKKGEP
ncbi:MAG: hypothetical protein OXI63_26265 [Candidatus Poribacteria bacterium]|nr:hypothetical protein [Candidatus Poribacteria bacterium]